MRTLVSFIVMVVFCGTAAAEEGMWTLDQLGELDLNAKGLKIGVEDIYAPDGECLADAAVLLGGGTSAFVSPDGLLLTNHHVAYGPVQRASTQGTDYLTDGFLARSHEEEIRAPGVSAQIITEMRDVTAEVLKAARGIKDPVKRQRAIDRRIRKMTDRIEKGKEDVSARIASMYSGREYVLYVYKRFDDIRIVYMPPLAIGNYGGDIDNWVWPRHTGDFAFARAYVSPDGVGRKYHEDNVPYHPKAWLRVSTGDLDEGDFAFTLGFPGRTSRFRTSHSAAYWYELYLPKRLRQFDDMLAALNEAAKTSPIAAMKVAGFQKGLSNVQKNWKEMLKAMERYDFVNKKRQEEKELMAFINKSGEYRKKYGDILDRIGALYAEQRKIMDHDDALNLIGGRGSVAARVAVNAVYYANEREKPKKDRDPNFSEEDVKRELFRLDSNFMVYFEQAERWNLQYALEQAAELPEGQRVVGLDYILKDPDKSISEWVDYIYKNTKITSADYARTLYDKTTRELAALGDPLIDLAVAVYPEKDESREKGEAFGARIDKLRERYIEALQLWRGGVMYPDANRTLRFSDGAIEGYGPRDAVVYRPFTTLSGVYEKDTGVEPFDMPAKLKEIYKAGDFGRWADPDLNDVPVAFLVSCDGTGGSSGSPVLNARGEMIGIAFDGVLEARLSDWKFDPSVAREICVDIRYVLFLVEKFGGADFLLEELGVPGAGS